MSRILQPHPEGGRFWAMAFAMSAALHAGVVIYALGVFSFNTPDTAPPVSFPDIAISNTVLEQQQLAALEPEEAAQIAADGADDLTAEEPVAPDAEELAPVEADDLNQADAEELAPVEAEDIAQAQAEDAALVEAEEATQAETEELAAVEAEDLAQAEVEEIAALEPDALEPVLPDTPAVTEQLSPVLPDTPLAESVAPTPSSPVLTPVSPVSTTDNLTIQGATIAPVRPATVTAAPVVSSVQTVARVAPVVAPPRPAAQSPRPAAAPPPPPSAEDLAVLELIRRIRGRFDPCLIALPQNQGPGRNPLVTLISDQERDMSAFVTDVLSDPNLPVEDRRVLIDSRQCAVLKYAREHRNYPAFRVDLTLQGRTIASGNNLVGSVSGLGGRYTSLLAVDSNGVVTDLRRFTQFRQGTAVLDAPVNVNGAPRDTSHLLIAIATPGLPSIVAQRSGWLAEDFFPPLREETDGQAVIGVLPFDVR